jgi:hypothetical protein
MGGIDDLRINGATMKLQVKEDHILTAVESYLKMMGMVEDDAVVTSVKRNRDNSFEVEIDE